MLRWVGSVMPLCWIALLMFGLVSPIPGFAQGPQPSDPKALLEAMEKVFVSVAERVSPAVVNVRVVQKSRGESRRQMEERFKDFFGEEFFERFFRRRGPGGPPEARSLGSGVIVDKLGYILTNNHVIEKADQIEVRLSDKRKFSATVVGRDPKTDLAVIKIEAAADLPAAKLGDSDKVRIGQWAIAIGNPFGLDRTVTMGIISATGRAQVGVTTYENFIQTDASINPGNSGGPLLNLDGEVIGINTAIVAVGQGIGFAIPINMAKSVMDQLVQRGKVVRGWLGVSIQELTDELASGFGVTPNSGVLVADVIKGSPAEAAGMRSGDIVVEFEGNPVTEVAQLQRYVAAVPPARVVKVGVVRDKQRRTLTVKIGEMPPDEMALAPKAEGSWGLSVQKLTPELAQQFKLTVKEGVLVSWVEPDSPAAKAGVRPGDAILEVNREKVIDLPSFQRAMELAKPGENLLIYLQREGRSSYLVLRNPEAKR